MKGSRFALHQRKTIVAGILSIVMVLVILQLWLFTATMNAYLGGDDSILLYAALASAVCLLLNLGLLRYVYALENGRENEIPLAVNRVNEKNIC